MAVYAQNEYYLLYRFSRPLFRPLFQAIFLLSVALIQSPVFTAAYCTAGARKCWDQGRVVRSQLLVDAGQLSLSLTSVMRFEISMHIHDYRTSAFDVDHQTRQYSRFLAFLRFSVVLQPGSTLFFCQTLAQLLFAALLFSSILLGLSTRGLLVNSREHYLSWGLDSSASLDGLGFSPL